MTGVSSQVSGKGGEVDYEERLVMDIDVEERVNEGAAWLDEVDPGWELKIDLGKLHMASCQQCIVGQVFGNFMQLENRMPLEEFTNADSGYEISEIISDFAFLHGFEAMEGIREYEAIARAWKELVKGRLDAGIALQG